MDLINFRLPTVRGNIKIIWEARRYGPIKNPSMVSYFQGCQIVWVILKNTIMLQKVTVHLFVA